MSILKLQNTYLITVSPTSTLNSNNTCMYLICASFYMILMDYITSHHHIIHTAAKHSSKQKTFDVF